VSAADIRKLADMYAKTKPAALKASWAPGRNAYGEQYNRMAAALQAMTGNIGVLGGCAEGVGKGWHAEAVAYPYDQYANIWFASIKSDRWAHIVLNYPNVTREEAGLWPRDDQWDGVIPNIKGIFWQGSDWFNQLTNINKERAAIDKMELVVCMDSTITPSGLYADVLLPVATHFERHDVALPWYKGHYYIHRPKVIEPMGESKSDFQIFTELAYRLGHKTGAGDAFGKNFNPRADRSYWQNPDPVDEAYLRYWWDHRVKNHQHVEMSWDEFKEKGVYKFVYDEPHVAFREQIEQGKPFKTPSGKIEILSTPLAQTIDWTKTRYGYHVPSIPKWIEPWESLISPKVSKYPFHLVTPHPRWRTHSIFNNCSWLRETYEQEVTVNASDARKLGIKTGDTVEVWNDRGKVVVPVYVTERVMPGVAVLHEGAWIDLDENGVDRSGNPDMLTLDEPSPAGAFAYNTILCNIRKTDLEHHPGWDQVGTSRSHVFRRDL
jgi:anaerobic dimethyl sulfoxide reductase subunit A